MTTLQRRAEYSRQWRAANRDRANRTQREWVKRRRLDPEYLDKLKAYHREYARRQRQLFPEKVRHKARIAAAKWKAKNPDYFLKYGRKQYWKDPERSRTHAKRSRAVRNSDPIRKDRHKAWVNGYVRKKKQNDVQFRLMSLFRRRLHLALKVPGYKSAPSAALLGCSIEEYKRYLESKWVSGMSWENHGKGEGKWHIDHIRPCASFDLRLPSQQQECFHFSNTQPLWESDNYKKGSKCVPV